MKQGQKLAKNLFFIRAHNQGGQAVIEYVLLLIITVSLLLATKGLFVGTQQFIMSYAGDYVVCLMEHGELPQLGVGNDDLKKHQGKAKCSAKFSIAGGASLSGGGSSGSGSSSSSSNSSGTNSKGSQLANKGNNSTNGANSGKDGKAGSGKGGAGSSSDKDGEGGGRGRSGRGGDYANGRINRSGSSYGVADGAAGTPGGDKVRVIAGEGDDLGFNRNGGYDRSSRVVNKNNRYKAITGQMYDEIEKTAKKEPRKPTSRKVATVKEEEAFRPGPRKSSFIPPERKPQAEYNDKDEDFSFGYLLKWLLIAGIVIAIIVFFGGQILNYSNSDS